MRSARLSVVRFGVFAALLFCLSAPSRNLAGQSQNAESRRQDVRNVLILNSYHAGFPWTDDLVASLEAAFDEFPEQVTVWSEYLDAKRSAYWQSEAISSYLAGKYQSMRLDLIVSTDDVALMYLLEHKNDLFGNAPVVFCGANEARLIERVPRSEYTGVREVFNSLPMLNVVLRLHPRTTRVVVVSDNSVIGQELRDTYRREAETRDDIQFTFLDGSRLALSEILGELRELSRGAIVLTTAFIRDGEDNYLPMNQAHRMIAEASPVPVYGPAISRLGQGIVGGTDNGGAFHGRVAARLALQVLEGVPPAQIPIEREANNYFVFDAERLRELGIGLEELPAESRLVNFEPSFYSQNSTWIWVAAGLLGLQTGVIVLLSVNISRRRRAEQDLRSASQRIQNIVNSSPMGIFLYRLQGDDRLIFNGANPSADRILGVNNSELLGKPIEEAFPGLSETVVPQKYREAARYGTSWHTEQIAYDDGRIKGAFEVNAFQISPGEVAVMFLDVTERKKAEQALRESEERLRLAAQSSRVAVWEYDPEVDLLEWDDLMYELYGADPASTESGYGRWVSSLHPEDVKRVDQEFEESLQDDSKPYDTEFRIVRASDGEIRYIRGLAGVIRDRSGRPVRVIGTNWDITNNKLAEQALRDSEQRFRSVIEQSNDAIYILFEGRFDLVNRRFSELTGVTALEASSEGFSFWELVAPESVPLIQERSAKRARGEEIPDVYEFEILQRAGKRVHVEASVTEIDYRGGKAVLGILRDVTEHRNLEMQLSQAQRMESIGRLSGGIAHDLNNLLTPILGYGEMLEDNPALEESTRAWAGQIVQAAYRARDLVRQLLAFSRRQTLEFRSIDITEMVRGFESLMRRTVREDIRIELRLPPSLPAIRGDKGQLEQVIMNLVVNAQDAMSEGGSLLIEAAEVDLDQEYAGRHTAVKPGPHVLLAVSDTGRGMDPEVAERVFEPFFTTKEIGKGTGLGLATVYGIVKQHDGNIWVYSEPDQGTTFKCYFPVAESVNVKSGAHAEAATVTAADGHETVMVVEDEQQVRDLTVSILSRKGYHVLQAEDGARCLEILEGHSGPLHLLLTDVVLPGLSGKEIYQAVRSSYPGIRVLYMSGYTHDRVATRGILDEGTDFLQKPFSTRALADKVREVLDRGQERSRL